MIPAGIYVFYELKINVQRVPDVLGRKCRTEKNTEHYRQTGYNTKRNCAEINIIRAFFFLLSIIQRTTGTRYRYILSTLQRTCMFLSLK